MTDITPTVNHPDVILNYFIWHLGNIKYITILHIMISVNWLPGPVTQQKIFQMLNKIISPGIWDILQYCIFLLTSNLDRLPQQQTFQILNYHF